MASQDASRGSDDLRRLLLDAALELLREPDTPLDLRKVAERAGKSRTAPYLVFGKGESGGVTALRIAVAAEGARLMQQEMVRAYEEGGDPFVAFERVAMSFLDFVEANPRLFRLMYGPEINVIGRIGEGGFLEHPEFQALLHHRDTAGGVVTELIHDAQDAGLLPGDPLNADEMASGPRRSELPSVRYLQIAWATMIGVSVLREDDLLRAIGWDLSKEQGARLIAESVLGLDPGPAEEAIRTFLSAPQLAGEGVAAAPSTMPPIAEVEDVAHELPSSLRRSVRLSAEPDQEIARPASPDLASMRPRMTPRLEARPRAAGAGGTFANVFRALRGRRREDEPQPDTPPASVVARSAAPGVPTDADETETTITGALGRYSGLRRAAYSPTLLHGARILWIDDHPDWVASVAETLRHLGAAVIVVQSTEDGLRYIERSSDAPIQVIISDIARGDEPQAGTDAIPALRAAAPGAAIVFHIADYEPERGIPEGALGITNNVDELLHLVLDALEGR